MSPLNKIIWVQSFRARKKIITIRDGRRFEADYQERKVFGVMTKMAYVRQIDSLNNTRILDGPCGWFRMEKVTDDQWLTTDNQLSASEKPVVPGVGRLRTTSHATRILSDSKN